MLQRKQEIWARKTEDDLDISLSCLKCK